MTKKSMGWAMLFLCLILSFSSPSYARTTATNAETTIGTACKRMVHGTDFDTVFQCNNSAGGTIQTAPLVVGTVTSPPYSNLLCDSSKAGIIQWTGSQFQVCDGSDLGTITLTNCVTPNAFSFTNRTGIATSSTITSNAITLSGSTFTCITRATCSGCTTILKNGVSQGTSAIFSTGDTAAIRLTSSSSAGTTKTATLTVGDRTSSTWSVTTIPDPCTGSPSVGTVCLDGTIYAGLSPDGNVKMYTTPCDYGMTGTKGNCTGLRERNAWGTHGVTTGYTSRVTGESNTSGLVANYASYFDGYSTGAKGWQSCQDLTAHGHSDWYLPALDELDLLYTNHAAIGNTFDMGGYYYMSSTEYSNNDAYIQRFKDGTQMSVYKPTTTLFRCVRK